MRCVECGARNGADRIVRLSGLSFCRLALTSAACHLALAALLNAAEPEFTLETIRGHVVYLADTFEKSTGVPSVPEAKDRILALETGKGDLIPLLEDVRGRAFRRDERLRKMETELLVRRYRGSPAVQIIRVFELAKDGKYELDYWCDICAIAMFELKDCECCQGPSVLRRQKVE